MSYYNRDDRKVVVVEIIKTVAVFFVLLLLAFGCASMGPTLPPEKRTTTNTVGIPKAVTCFDETSLPAVPTRTKVAAGATTDQLAAAAAVDAEAFMRYGMEMYKQAQVCLKQGAKKT